MMTFPLNVMTACLGALIASSCAAENSPEITQGDCEGILSSFSVVPTAPQSKSERLEMLALIKAEQEVEFAERCGRFDGWTQRFEAAHEQAIRQVTLKASEGGDDRAVDISE